LTAKGKHPDVATSSIDAKPLSSEFAGVVDAALASPFRETRNGDRFELTQLG